MSTPIVPAATLRTYIEKLTKAIGSGVRSVTLGGQTITYNTATSLIEARDNMVKQLRAQEAADSPTKRSRQNYAVYAGRDND
jgi:PBP1b-binding outer membrane lipoprotein LpoB